MGKNSATSDRSLILDKNNLEKFSLVTLDKLSDLYYNSNSLFIVIKDNVLIHTFSTRKRFIKGYNIYKYIWENTIKSCKFYSNGESQKEYIESITDFYPYLIEQVKNNRLYTIKL